MTRRRARLLVLLTVLPLLAAGCPGDPPKPDVTRRPGTGKIDIRSVPSGALVIEDGHRRLGHTPLVVERPAMARLDLQLIKDGYIVHRVRRVVEEGRTVRLNAVLRPQRGLAVVRSGLVRGATILVDGKEVGRTPRKVELVAGERHVLEVRKYGYDSYRTSVTLEAGETRDVDALLRPLGKRQGPTGWLTVRADVPAMVELDGQPLGSTPLERIMLPARRYGLTLRNPQLKLTKKVRVHVRAGKTEEITVSLAAGAAPTAR